MRTWQGADGVRIAGDEWGPADGPLVVLMHGGGQTRHAWKGTGRMLADAGYRAIAYDARGHGDSEWHAGADYDTEAMVQDLVALLAHLGDARPVLIGASMGGITSLMALGEGLVDARAIVLVDIATRIETDGKERILDFMRQKPDGFESLAEVADAIASYQPQRERRDNLQGLVKNVRLGANGRLLWHWDPRFMEGHTDVEERHASLQDYARTIRVPALLVRGGKSDVLSDEGVREFQALVPHSEFVNVASAGHMVAGDRNDAFGRVAVDFLTRVLPVGRSA
jgi:non-heme chloroperoxidase